MLVSTGRVQLVKELFNELEEEVRDGLDNNEENISSFNERKYSRRK